MACKSVAHAFVALVAVVAAAEEAACFANGTCPGGVEADTAALLQARHLGSVRRQGHASALTASCHHGAHVPCPGSGNMCAGDQCCPRTAASGELTFPCPSAAPGFSGCESNEKLEDCLEPKACCMAMNAKCLACSAGMTEEAYCQQNPTTPGCPPKACCMAMNAKCLACSAGMTEEAYCQQNPTVAGCDARLLQSNSSKGQRKGTCQHGAHVPCPGSGNMCAGDQCCPRTAASGELTFPCPSAGPGFSGCESNQKVEDCLEPKACCMAMNAKCLACSAGMTEEAYCQQNPTTPGCPPKACCMAMNAKCLACSAGMTEEAYCQQNPTVAGCDARLLQSNSSKGHRKGTCQHGAHVPCPGSGNMCAGDQCCPRTAASGELTFPCPSAGPGFSGCESDEKLENCLEPKACCRAMNAKCLACSAGMTEEAYCQQNPTVAGCDARLLQSNSSKGLRKGTCQHGAHVPCPGSGNMCAGDQCCPRTAASGELTFPCPSAAPGFSGCESNEKLEDCLEPKACCMAMNSKCLACSAGMTEEAYCQQNPTTPGCPPRACCRAMNAKCLACSAGMTEEAYCQQNPTVAGCDARLLQSISSKGLRKGACKHGAHVPCPGSGNMCAGDQCCPRTAASGELTFPCPSAAPGFSGCERNEKVEDCLEPKACCAAVTAECLACSAGMSEEEYCQKNPTTPGCPPKACCAAMTAECLACSAGMSEEEYCQQNPTTPGCPPKACCMAMTAECLACTAGMSVEEYCKQNPTAAGCPEPYQPETCAQGESVPCPGSGNMCMGDQCCPGTEMSGGQTFPCPSASEDFKGCGVSTKLADCVSA